jgi:hypothetical protein
VELENETNVSTFTSSKNRLLIAAEDGGGIIKSNGEVTILGPVTMFSGGEVLGTLNR